MNLEYIYLYKIYSLKKLILKTNLSYFIWGVK